MRCAESMEEAHAARTISAADSLLYQAIGSVVFVVVASDARSLVV